MKPNNLYTTALIAAIAGSAGASVTITGIVDGDISSNPKAIELYVDGTVDFTGFDLFRSSNGGTFMGAGGMDALGTITDSFVYLVGNSSGLTSFQTVFGMSGDFANTFILGGVSFNGDDGFQIVDAGSTVLDQVWKEDTTDSYRDSYLYRINGTGPEGAVWTPGNWMIPGNDTLEDMNAQQTEAAVPFGTYQVPSPGALSLLTIGGLVATRRRRA